MSPRRRSLRPWALLAILALPVWFAWQVGGTDLEAAAQDAPEEVRATERPAPVAVAPVEAQASSPARIEAQPTASSERASADPSGEAASEKFDWTLRGEVRDPEGRPVELALVGLLRLGEEGPGNRGDRAAVLTDKRGVFELAVPAWARGAPVLLAARREKFRPHSEEVRLAAEDVARPWSLALEVGYAIAGRVVRDGHPVRGAHVSIDVAYGTGGVFGFGLEAWWAGGRLEEKHGSATTAEDGSFVLPGMGPYEHRMQIHTAREGVPNACGHVYQVQAPSSEVYDVSTARLAVLAMGPEGPVEGAELFVSIDSAGAQAQSTTEPMIVEVPPRTPIHVSARHPMFAPAEFDVESPDVGQVSEVHVTLEPVERPSLTAYVPGATAAGVTNIGLRVQLLRGISDTQLAVRPGSAPDTFEVAAVPVDPDDYNLILEPDTSGGTGRYLSPRTKEVRIPASGNVVVEFDLALFGRCEVHVSSSHEGDWHASLHVAHADGTRLMERVLFYSAPLVQLGPDEDVELEASEYSEMSLDSFSFRGGSKFRWFEDAGAVAARCGVLPAGTHSIQVESHGHAQWTGPVTIRPGETTKLNVTLVPVTDG